MPHDAPIHTAQFEALLALARDEDIGMHGDLTTRLMAEGLADARGRWHLVARRPGRFCGNALLPTLLEHLAPAVDIEWIDEHAESAPVQPGKPIARFAGRATQMLTAERIFLNFLQHLSGVATLTAAYVHAVAGTGAKIYDTRKTTPGMRTLERYAVRVGGGHNHRDGLYDAVLIKDNHLAGVPVDRLAHRVFEMLNGLARLPSQPAFVEVECDGLDQLAELLKIVGIDVILLDNFDVPATHDAVRMRDDAGLRGKVELEASGRITLQTVRDVAETGVERIAVGAITHSAPILDLGIDAA